MDLITCFQFDGIHVVSGSLDTSIRVWDVETGACKHALMGHQSLTSGMELRDNILVSGNADSTVKVWDITTGQCLQTLSGLYNDFVIICFSGCQPFPTRQSQVAVERYHPSILIGVLPKPILRATGRELLI
jgi:WD40 repeat protein